MPEVNPNLTPGQDGRPTTEQHGASSSAGAGGAAAADAKKAAAAQQPPPVVGGNSKKSSAGGQAAGTSAHAGLLLAMSPKEKADLREQLNKDRSLDKPAPTVAAGTKSSSGPPTDL